MQPGTAQGNPLKALETVSSVRSCGTSIMSYHSWSGERIKKISTEKNLGWHQALMMRRTKNQEAKSWCIYLQCLQVLKHKYNATEKSVSLLTAILDTDGPSLTSDFLFF